MTDLIGLIANVALALSFIVGLIFGIAQVRAAARDRRDRLTLESLRNFQSRDFVEQMQYVISHEMPSCDKRMGKVQEDFAEPSEHGSLSK